MANDWERAAGEAWARWFQRTLDAHPTIRRQVDVVAASPRKQDDSPIIDRTRVSNWLKGSRPTPRLAQALAAALGIDEAEVLHAAGYVVERASPEEALEDQDQPAGLMPERATIHAKQAGDVADAGDLEAFSIEVRTGTDVWRFEGRGVLTKKPATPNATHGDMSPPVVTIHPSGR